MSKRTPQEKLNRAVSKRDKWASRVAVLEAAIATNSPAATQPVERGLPEGILRGFGPGKKYSGLCTQVAKKLSLTSKYVMYVARGRTLDSTTLNALLQAAAQRDAQPPVEPPFTSEQLQAFRYGGRYFGVLSQVAKTLGISSSFPTLVARGKSRSASVLSELKRRVTEIDRQVADQQKGGAIG